MLQLRLRRWGVADSKGKFDEVVEENGVQILIEPTAIMHVLGTTMDFVEDRIRSVLLLQRSECTLAAATQTMCTHIAHPSLLHQE